MKLRCALIRLIVAAVIAAIGASHGSAAPAKVIRVGHFPNITHAQALVGLATGEFKKEIGPNVEIKTFVFNAGPSAMEALMARELDLCYVGPNPAITCYIRTNGDALRIVAGAASGGAGLVIRNDVRIGDPADLAGKSLATPQLGNTQDVALRHYLKDHGLKTKEYGGTVRVIPAANPDQLTLMLKKEIHGAWTVEPWVTRLIREAGGKLFLDERAIWPKGMFVTGHLAARREFLAQQPKLVKAWIRAHVRTTREIEADSAWARRILNQEIKRLTTKALPEAVLAEAWTRLDITYDPVCASLHQSAQWAYELGFLGKTPPDLSGIYDLRLLNQVLAEMQLKQIK